MSTDTRRRQPMERVHHIESEAHPVDDAIDRRFPLRSLRDRIQRATKTLEKALGSQRHLWLKLEEPLNELRSEREDAYFNLGYEHGFAEGRRALRKTAPAVRELAARLQDRAIQKGGRREEIGLSQGDICRALSYRSLNSVSNLETGREGLPAKRIYAWADILQLPRDAFFRFVTGEIERMDASGEGDRRGVRALTTAEKELLETYRGLPPRYQQRLREQAHEFETLARAGSAKRRPKR